MAKRRKKKQQLSFKAIVVIALVVAIAVALYILVPPVKVFVDSYLYPETGPSVQPSAFQGAGENELAVHFIDVGQGDSILIELPDGKKMVIDGGDRAYEDEVQDYITAMGITKIDYLIATHYDSDHIGGLDGVFAYTEVDVAYLPDIKDAENKIGTGVYNSLMEAVRTEEGCEIRYNLTGHQISTEGTANAYRITWLSPEQSEYDRINAKKNLDSYDKNDVSPIMLLEYQGKKIVFTGDANCPVEEQVVTNFNNGVYGTLDLRNIDLLKAGHHGSNGTGSGAQITNGSTSQKFLDLLKPKSVVISCGEGNSHGHPHQETLDRIELNGAETYRTDYHGTVVATILADESQPLKITTQKTVDEPEPSTAPSAASAMLAKLPAIVMKNGKIAA